MKEYRVMAYFKESAPLGYGPRSYKRKVVTDLKEAEKLLKEARRYYRKYKYLEIVRIESRSVSEWV